MGGGGEERNTMYPETLLNLFMVDSLGFPTYKIMSSVNRDCFTSSFYMDAFYIFFLPDYSG